MADFSYEKKGEQETHYVYDIHVHDGNLISSMCICCFIL